MLRPSHTLIVAPDRQAVGSHVPSGRSKVSTTRRHSDGRRQRVAHTHWRQSLPAYGVCAALLLYAVSLQMLSAGTALWLIAGMALSLLGLKLLARQTHYLHRHDPGLHVPLAALSLALLIGIEAGAGPARAEILAATLPALLLAAVYLRRARICWALAVAALAGGMTLLALRRAGWHTDTAAWLFIGALCLGFAMLYRGPRRMVKRMRWQALDIWVRSTETHQRTFILRFVVGAFNCVVSVVALNLALAGGISHDAQAVQWVNWLSALVITLFYVVFRSGLNKRLADPSMTEQQIQASITFLAFGYYLAGEGEGIALVMLIIMLMFGMFSTTSRKIVRSGVYGLIVFGIAMLAVYHGSDDPHARRLQWMHFGVLAVILPTVFMLAGQLAGLRASLRKRKEALSEALTRIQELATRDELTGLINRRHMLEQLALQQQRALRADTCFCLCLVDLDFFKQVNDVHGHGVGDEVLVAFSKLASASLRETDLIARWGGEEFLVMLPDAECQSAQQVIERMRQAIGQARLSASVPELVTTFSAGMVCSLPGEPLPQVIERADRLLYQAKAAGRNRTVTT